MSSGRPVTSSPAHRRWPPWVRWALPLGIALVLVAAVVIYVETHQTPLVQPPSNPSQSQLKQEMQEDYQVQLQQQAPHVATAHGTSPSTATLAAVAAYMEDQVSHGFIGGPYQHGSCQTVGGSSTRQVVRCNVYAASLRYPFDAVVAPARHTVTFCQVVTPIMPSLQVPISSRCR